MPRRFASFRASDVEPIRLQRICSTYFAYERARAVRQLLVWRLLVVLVGTALVTLGLHLLPTAALGVVGALGMAGVWLTVRSELRAKHLLRDQLRDVPDAHSAGVPP